MRLRIAEIPDEVEKNLLATKLLESDGDNLRALIYLKKDRLIGVYLEWNVSNEAGGQKRIFGDGREDPKEVTARVEEWFQSVLSQLGMSDTAEWKNRQGKAEELANIISQLPAPKKQERNT